MIRVQRRQLPSTLAARMADRAKRLQESLAAGEAPSESLLSSYRDPELKAHLISEAHGKCIYCESRVTHVYFGDVEHLKPKGRFPEERLNIDNLALTCAICNNTKRDYWDDATPLINPYLEDPETELIALGFMLSRRPGHDRARATVHHLGLNRPALLERRKERVELLENLADQYVRAPIGAVKDLLREELCRQAADDSEYAFVVRAYLEAACALVCP